MAEEKEKALVTSFPLLQSGEDGKGSSGESADESVAAPEPATESPESAMLDSLFSSEEPPVEE